jgi:hypothetical protein
MPSHFFRIIGNAMPILLDFPVESTQAREIFTRDA